MAGRVIFAVGIVLLLHAAFSAIQHRTFLSLEDRASSGLPLDIILQSLIALTVGSVGLVKWMVNFKDIKADADSTHKTFDTAGNCSSFYSFQHRGQVIYSDS
ncbi:ER membrane protein complex subunit 5-like [Oscarella lobularis]|uniref:ER membrane protein complex subunit 5-like n=1 Tax=Oscarella lobularis TaxID=121494 RepID=UPI0033141BC6